MDKKTNDLKKGTIVKLVGGLIAEIVDNRKGDTRRIKTIEPTKDEGDTWAHRILEYQDNEGNWHSVIHTKSQEKTKKVWG